MLRKLNAEQKRTVAHWAMELVVVVFGVLLALWLQDLSTAEGKHRDAVAAEAAIRAELDNNLMILVAQDVIAACQNDRLDEIEQELLQERRADPITGNTFMEPRPERGRSSVYEFFALQVSDTAWQSAVANGSLSSIPADRYRKLSAVHSEFADVQRRLEQNGDASHTLQILSYGSDLTPDLRAQLVRAFSIVKGNRAYFSEALPAREVADQMSALGWNDKGQIDAKIREYKASVTGYGFKFKPCARPFRNPFG